MKKTIIFGIMVLLTIGMVSAEYKGEFTAGTYLNGDTVLWQGNCYAAVGNLPNIPETWNPTSPWAAYWTQVDLTNCQAPSNSNEWVSGHNYQTGDEVEYNGITYTVRQSHTSQSDWTPNAVLSLYKPVDTSTQVTYLPPESNYQPSEYASMTESELKNFMDFTYIGAELKDDGIDYVWKFFHPEMDTSGDVKWIYKPMTVKLTYDTIDWCDDYYSTSTCVNILVTGTDNSTINNQTVTPIITSAVSQAQSEVQNALDFQQKVLYEINAQDFLVGGLDISLN